MTLSVGLKEECCAVLLRVELLAQVPRVEKGGSFQTTVLCEGKQMDL